MSGVPGVVFRRRVPIVARCKCGCGARFVHEWAGRPRLYANSHHRKKVWKKRKRLGLILPNVTKSILDELGR